MARAAQRKPSKSAAARPDAARANPRLIRQLHHQPHVPSMPHHQGSGNDIQNFYDHRPLTDDQMGFWVDQRPGEIPFHTEAYKLPQIYGLPLQTYQPPVQTRGPQVQAYQPPPITSTYQLPIRSYSPGNIVDPRMTMGPPQKRSLSTNLDIVYSAPKRRAISSNTRGLADTGIITPNDPYADIYTRYEPLSFQDKLPPDEDMPEYPSSFDEAYEAILLARAIIDLVEIESSTEKTDEFWSYCEY